MILIPRGGFAVTRAGRIKEIFTMKINKLILFAGLSAAVLAGGCSGDKKEAAGPSTPEEDRMKPNEVVEEVLRGFQTGDASAVPEKFSSRVPAKLLEGYIQKVSQGRELLQFAASKPDVKGDTARVEYLFFYQEKKKVEGGEYEPFGKRIKAKGRALLTREKGEWRIRSLEPALDGPVEDEIFMSCLKAVSIAQLSEEKYYGANRGFTRSFADMGRYLPVDLEACGSIDVYRVDKDDYGVRAVTRNVEPCEITATRRSVSPTAYSGCAPRAVPVAEEKPAGAPSGPRVVIETLR